MEDWFKLKKYPHIGLPIKQKDYQWVKEFVTNANKVKNYSFLPYIFKSIVKRKYRPNKADQTRNPSGKRKRIVGPPKVRPIFYASHLDAIIYSYYNWLLHSKYENFIHDKPFKDSIVAYRKIPIRTGQEKNKCNIEFAKSAFDFIRKNDAIKLSVIVADITSFFDNLNHQLLKRQWCKILDKSTLPADHFNIFKSITRIRYVESEQLFLKLEKRVIVERRLPNNDKQKEYKTIKVERQKYFKEKNVVAFCSKKNFLDKHLSLVVNLRNGSGIPQGSPISATLANVYMLDFDALIWKEVNEKEGFYMRYSDDLIIICNQDDEDYFIRLVRNQIQAKTQLEIKEEKTKVYRFEKIKNIFKGFQVDEKTKEPFYNKPLEFLGFTFDGQRVLIKSSGFSKFYRSMKRSFKKATSLAKYSKNPDKSIFKGKLFKRFTYKGSRRKLIYHPSKEDNTNYIRTTKFYWGNYISYLLKANNVMKEINGNNLIKSQSRRFYGQFIKLMKDHNKDLDKFLQRKQNKQIASKPKKTE